MPAPWTIGWIHRHSLIMETNGLKSVRDSRKMPDGVRMVLGKLAENDLWIVFKQEEKGKDAEGRILPGDVTEFITPETGVASKVAYNTYLEIRDAAGLKPAPKTPKDESAEGETQGSDDSEPESETEGSEESKPKAKSKSKADK